jgi:hypothetical protein
MECQKELGHPSFETFFLPYYEDRLTEVECSRHHKSVLLLQSQKFEVLLESGANALAAGFTLEAAASFSSGLERFYEFCVKVITAHRDMSPVVYEQMFKEMANQSERQLGAFLALHAIEFGSAYVTNKKIIEFRNSVVHKGRIPTPDEATGFCERVYSEILLLTQKLEPGHRPAINKVIAEDLRKRAEGVPKGTPIATTTGTMFFSLAHQDKKPTFAEAYEAYLKAKNAVASAVPVLGVIAPLLRTVTTPEK